MVVAVPVMAPSNGVVMLVADVADTVVSADTVDVAEKVVAADMAVARLKSLHMAASQHWVLFYL